MPHKERAIVDRREQMALRALDDRFTTSELAEMFGVSRPTVRLWRERYRENGRAGLEDRSHATRSCPHRTTIGLEPFDEALWTVHFHRFVIGKLDEVKTEFV